MVPAGYYCLILSTWSEGRRRRSEKGSNQTGRSCSGAREIRRKEMSCLEFCKERVARIVFCLCTLQGGFREEDFSLPPACDELTFRVYVPITFQKNQVFGPHPRA